MQKSVRQSMAWLHSWVGLLFGWLLFTIFLFGTLSYYKNQITDWMQPEWNSIQVSQTDALHSAWSYLDQNAKDAQLWYINVATQAQPFNRIYWQKADSSYEFKTLDYRTGKELTTTTQGGEFFYNFHFQLYKVPIMLGRMITSLAAFFMLIALISGIITHKKIFADFFTLRTFKAQRSWLDFHNVVSVIALPFFLTITFTGLSIFFYIYVPYGIQKNYLNNQRQFFTDIAEVSSNQHLDAKKNLPIISSQQLQANIEKKWGTVPELDTISVKNPHTSGAKIVIKQKKDQSISLNTPQLVLDGATGKILSDTRRNTPIATLYGSIYGLHMAYFAQPLLRFALFFSGLLGCVMIASGLLLWSLKRQLQLKKHNFHFGYYLVDRLNISTLVGAPIATLAYFYCNRVWTPTASENVELNWFFGAWALSIFFALITPKAYLWRSQLAVFILLAACLPIVNIVVLIQHQWIHTWQDYCGFIGFDLSIIAFGGLAIFIFINIHPIQKQAKKRILKKLHHSNTMREDS